MYINTHEAQESLGEHLKTVQFESVFTKCNGCNFVRHADANVWERVQHSS